MRVVLFCICAIGVLFDTSVGMNKIQNSAEGVRKFVSEVSVLLPVTSDEAVKKISDTMSWIVQQGESTLDKNAKVTMLDAIDRNFGEQISDIRLAAQTNIKGLVTADIYSSKGYGNCIWEWINADSQERGTEEFVRAAISKLYVQDKSSLQGIAPKIVQMGMRLYLPSRLTYSWK